MLSNNDILSLSAEERKIINEIYQYQISNTESIRDEEIALTLESELDSIDNRLLNLINKGIIYKNGDRYNIGNDCINDLIVYGVINLSEILHKFSYDTYYSKCDINQLKVGIEELKKEKSILEYEIEATRSELNSARKALDNDKIKLIELLGVFISIFTLISVNVNFLQILSTNNSLKSKVILLVAVNATIIIAIAIMLMLIKKYIFNDSNK